MKEPLKVSKWRYYTELIRHWAWCELHYGATWYRYALRRIMFNTEGNLLVAWLVMLAWFFLFAILALAFVALLGFY